MEEIMSMARELGYAIQQDECFIRTQMAQAAADEDEALQGVIGEFNLKRLAINTEKKKETQDEEKLTKLDEEIREVYGVIMENEHMKAYNEAKKQLDKLVNDIATIVTLSANGQNPDDIETTGGCGGECAGCSGCH